MKSILQDGLVFTKGRHLKNKSCRNRYSSKYAL